MRNCLSSLLYPTLGAALLGLGTACGGEDPLSFQASLAPALPQPALEPTGDFLEIAHEIDARLGDGVIEYNITRHFQNTSGYDQEADFILRLPKGGAASDVRVVWEGQRFDGALLRSTEAQEKYERFAGFTEELIEAPAFIVPPTHVSWDQQGVIHLRAHPVASNKTLTVEYKVVQPTCYEDGTIVVAYPLPEAEGHRIVPELKIDGAGFGHHPSIDFEYDNEQSESLCSFEPPSARIIFDTREVEYLEGRYAKLDLGEQKAFELGIDIAKTLEPAPIAPSIVFVLDGSYSFDDFGLAEQLRIAQAYLSHLKDANFEVITFNRRAERLLGYFTSSASAGDIFNRIPKERLQLANGSHLDEALYSAIGLLDGQSGPKRIVLFTDGFTRGAIEMDSILDALEKLGENAVLHVIDGATSPSAEDVPPNLDRKDGHRLFDLASVTGGVVFEFKGGLDDKAALRKTVLELVRPIAIDHFEVAGLDVEPFGRLDEGSSQRLLRLADAVPEEVQLSGYIWGRPWSRTLSALPGGEARVAGLLIGDRLHRGLSDEEIFQAANIAKVVSPMTSFLIIDGAAPNQELMRGFGIGGIFASSCGCCGGIGAAGRIGLGHYRYDFEEQLRNLLAEVVEGCGAEGVRIEIETTQAEIVDVRISGEEATRTCLEDGIWSKKLPEDVPWGFRTISVAY